MRLERKKRPQAAKQEGTPQNNNDSLPQRRRLTDEEWRALWNQPDSILWVGAVAVLIAAAVGVI